MDASDSSPDPADERSERLRLELDILASELDGKKLGDKADALPTPHDDARPDSPPPRSSPSAPADP